MLTRKHLVRRLHLAIALLALASWLALPQPSIAAAAPIRVESGSLHKWDPYEPDTGHTYTVPISVDSRVFVGVLAMNTDLPFRPRLNAPAGLDCDGRTNADGSSDDAFLRCSVPSGSADFDFTVTRASGSVFQPYAFFVLKEEAPDHIGIGSPEERVIGDLSVKGFRYERGSSANSASLDLLAAVVNTSMVRARIYSDRERVICLAGETCRLNDTAVTNYYIFVFSLDKGGAIQVGLTKKS